MDGERIIKIVLLELSNEKLKLEESLEKAVNSNKEIDEKVKEITDLLKAIAINDGATLIWTSQTNNENK